MFDLDVFVDSCRSALAAPKPAETVAELLRDAIADRAQVADAIARWRASGGEGGVIHRSDDLTVMHASVPPGFASPAHDHTIWAVIGVFDGPEDNTFYRLTDAGLEETHCAELRAGDVTVLPLDAIHRIANPLPTTLQAIHVYGGDLMGIERSAWNDETGERTPFDLATISRARSD